ncbi:hypothetical protein [Agromyces marinus]|uniref:hypothetical protein n=1 Tax=Agromyces marinus TaxID=1389020 RepID=UPI001F2E57D4|nr:hypothetical protein [Agromyces marinus]UIP59072.1 hypothetical protein DSM26151_19670 [Agromyces marinus]
MRTRAALVAHGRLALTGRPTRRSRWSPRVRWRVLPWWARVTLIYAAARAITTVFVLVMAQGQAANAWTGAKPGYFAYANLWDARWYAWIAVGGYPSDLPIDDNGHVAENAWAFLPAFPAIVRVFTTAGLPWDVASVLVALAAGLGAALVFHRLMTRFLEPDQAMFAVVLFCVAPVAPIMQFGYAESLGFLWLAIALLLLVDRRYVWLLPVLAVWAFTRPGALAFALTLGLHWIVRWFTRERDPFPAREQVVVASVAVFAGLVGLAWPVVAWAVTGSPTAYLDTELAWRAPYIGYVELAPLTPWFQSGDWWLGQPMGTIAPIALVVGFAVFLFTPWVKRLGVDLRLWCASYALYLFAVFFPQSSTFRLLAPLFPLAGALAVPRSPWWRGGLVVASLALQVGWLLIGWRIDGYDWTPP